MSSRELREKFLKFFKEHGHAIVPSSPLIPDDPSVLLTTAGMQQFKPYYTGQADPMVSPHPTLGGKPLGSLNAASIQKSFRTSDIDEVGDERHNTFFEMMGNFSFGGYFKEEAITYGYEFLKSELGLEIDYVTVFDPEKVPEGDWRKHGVPFDQKSYEIWKKIGMPESKIRREGVDNFWGPTGGEGPCGPTTEIYIDGIEVWNIVFNQFYCDKAQKLKPLKTQGVDTGMGLERLALVSQFPGQAGKKTIFDTDLFTIPLRYLIGGPKFSELRSTYIVGDHLRAAVFLLADGVQPSNKEAGYVLRRLIRRLWVHASRKLGMPEIQLYNFARSIAEFYGEIEDYRALRKKQSMILEEFEREIKRFQISLDKGLNEFFKRYPELRAESYAPNQPISIHTSKSISIDDAFYFHQTYGLTLDVIKELASEGLHQVNIDELSFERELERHREISRAGQERKFGGHGLLLDTGELKAANEEELVKVTRFHTATHLLQSALRKVLGESVHQAGSDITVERTRFDFTFDRKLTAEEIEQVEDLVNKAIQDDLVVSYEELPYEQAVQTGALHFAKEKYPPKVKVYTMDSKYPEPFSKELCGGPHVTHTGEVGKFRIMKEEAVGAGIRRLRAVLDEL